LSNKSKTFSNQIGLSGIMDETKWNNIVLNSVNDMVGFTDREGKLLYISPSVEKILGWTPEERISLNGIDLSHEDDIPTILSSVNQLNERNEVCFEYRCLTKSGSYIWVENSVKLITNTNDKEKYLIFIARDIQKRKELEEQLARTSEELSQSNQMKEKLLSLIAHDLQNPIFSIITLTSFVKSKLDSIQTSEIRDFISQINESAQNSYILLENLMLWDRVHRGALSLNPELIKVNKIVMDNLDLLKHQVTHKNLDFKCHIGDNLYIYADFYILDTIIKNIISNAVKYTPAKGKITVTASKTDGNVIIKIKDTGIGMSEEQQKYLFQADSRKRLNNLSTSHGSGLGLILCNELIAQYQGQITAESKVNKGSVFTITFPQPEKHNPA